VKITVGEREGDGLIELEQALDALLATADAEKAIQRHATIVIDLDLGGARQLRNALQLARLSGSTVQ
jgi:hypothetical protein